MKHWKKNKEKLNTYKIEMKKVKINKIINM